MRYDIPAAAAEIAQSQAGAISRKQLLDAYYEEYKLAAELDGRLAHPDQERWRDTHRDNQAGAQGILTTRYGWREVYGHPARPPCSRPGSCKGAVGRAPPAVLGHLPGWTRQAQDRFADFTPIASTGTAGSASHQ